MEKKKKKKALDGKFLNIQYIEIERINIIIHTPTNYKLNQKVISKNSITYQSIIVTTAQFLCLRSSGGGDSSLLNPPFRFL